MIEVINSSEMSASIYQITRRDFPEDRHLRLILYCSLDIPTVWSSEYASETLWAIHSMKYRQDTMPRVHTSWYSFKGAVININGNCFVSFTWNSCKRWTVERGINKTDSNKLKTLNLKPWSFENRSRKLREQNCISRDLLNFWSVIPTSVFRK
jgi:hypothetical protein